MGAVNVAFVFYESVFVNCKYILTLPHLKTTNMVAFVFMSELIVLKS